MAPPALAPSFVADVHLARLARHLRLMGYDTVWGQETTDEELARLSREENRWLLTRDRALHDSHVASGGRGHYVLATEPDEQLREVIGRWELKQWLKPFTRCLDCNSVLLPTKAHHVIERVARSIVEAHEDFFLCSRCERVYWKGSHYDRMIGWLGKFFKD